MLLSKSKRIAMGVCLILALTMFVFQTTKTNAQSDIAVQTLEPGTEHVTETFYEYDGVTGSANINIEIPAMEVRGKLRQTVLVYGTVRFPDSNGSGAIVYSMIPTRGAAWEASLMAFTVQVTYAAMVLPYSLPIYPGSKAHLTWTNPGTVKWKMVLYTKAIVN